MSKLNANQTRFGILQALLFYRIDLQSSLKRTNKGFKPGCLFQIIGRTGRSDLLVKREHAVVGFLGSRLGYGWPATHAKGAQQTLPRRVVSLRSEKIRVVFEVESLHDPTQQPGFRNDLQLSIEIGGV